MDKLRKLLEEKIDKTEVIINTVINKVKIIQKRIKIILLIVNIRIINSKIKNRRNDVKNH